MSGSATGFPIRFGALRPTLLKKCRCESDPWSLLCLGRRSELLHRKGADVSMLVSILRAVHCRSTHHYFAIDALDRIQTPGGRRLASVLLTHYSEYLLGAKAPDTKFKDFQNHVIHVSDNQWGGAPQACEIWLARAIEAMHESDWRGAAYALGVLSHYFTDPLMPLHTAQHPSESIVHRPLEWSICKAYDSISRKCTNQVSFPLESGSAWMRTAVLTGSAIAHPHYLPLIEFYDLKKGVADPPQGLDARSRAILTELFDYVLTGWARVLERIAVAALVEIPILSLNMPTFMAAMDVPVAWVVRRVSDAAERRAVKAIFEEFKATGKVVRHVSPEIRAVASAKPKRAPANIATRAKVALHTVNETDTGDSERSPLLGQGQTAAALAPPDAPLDALRASHESPPAERWGAAESRPIIAAPDSADASVPSLASRITLDSDIVDAPSIGLKTAARFYQIGIRTIGQFLAASPVEMTDLLQANWVDAPKLIDWQDQARFVVQVPALCGYKSQLLIGVECRRVEELASQDSDRLHRAVDVYCATDAGVSILRSAAVPSRDEVAQWILSAQASEPLQSIHPAA
jgi:hypothetical protein